MEIVADEYKDAADKAKECYFNQAEKLYGEKKYTEAAEYYTKAGDYTGAAEKVKECSYMNGETLAEQKKYDEAVKAYETAGDIRMPQIRSRNVTTIMHLTKWKLKSMRQQKSCS